MPPSGGGDGGGVAVPIVGTECILLNFFCGGCSLAVDVVLSRFRDPFGSCIPSDGSDNDFRRVLYGIGALNSVEIVSNTCVWWPGSLSVSKKNYSE